MREWLKSYIREFLITLSNNSDITDEQWKKIRECIREELKV